MPVSIVLDNGTSSVKPLVLLLLAVALSIVIGLQAPGREHSQPQAKAQNGDSGCTTASCHGGIEEIRDRSSGMMRAIFDLGRDVGDPAGCVVCHGGDPRAATTEQAHRGAPATLGDRSGPDAFFPDPGSPWVNARSCGPCHGEHIGAQWNSLMMTEAGKIQGTSWSFGSLQGYDHGWANYDLSNPLNLADRRGTDAYRAYMQQVAEREPGAYPAEMKTVPAAPVDLATLAEFPEQACFTYIRSECERCHLGVRGRSTRGDYRGMGCSACHIPYGNEGLYEGNDPTIPRDEPRHLLFHAIQSSREAQVTIHGSTYAGIPVETCTTCHDRGKRIGVTYQGLMESAFTSPFREGGEPQLDLHTKHYIAMSEDIHYQKGMLCQDCHTSIDLHGDGFLAGTNLAQIQIECTDCHGTPDAYPWELPLGYGDEFGRDLAPEPRGVLTTLPNALKQGTVHPPEDGYLVTARGNPFPEVVRRGDLVVVHTAAGRDLELRPLKLASRQDELALEPLVAMDEIGMHIDEMECYSCHSAWAPQCYGCHLKIDYSGNKRSFDWVAAGHRHAEPEHRTDSGEAGYDTTMPGRVSEQRSYMRFEDPALGVNGEGRITPVVPGCQPSITVIGPAGETILLNHIFRSKPGSEGAGEEGQLCIDMSPGQPHTTGRARSCESCHASEKALGYGIGGGRIFRGWDEPVTVDLMTADGQVLPKNTRPQVEAIEGLAADWSRFVTEDGRQLMTVGHHFSLSRPLNDDERAHTSRQGVCIACHQQIPSRSLAVNLLHHVGETAGLIPLTAVEHDSLVNKILLFSAWVQAGGGLLAAVAGLTGVLWLRRRIRRYRRSNAGP